MKRLSRLLTLLLLLPVFAFAANTDTSTVSATGDTAWYHQLVTLAGSKLQQQIALNEHLRQAGRESEMQFVINIMPGAGEPYLIDEGVGEGDAMLKDYRIVRDTLESHLKKIYSTYRVEAYLVLLNYFTIKMKHKVKGSYTVDDIFNGNLLDDSLNIQELKDQHELITNGIAYSQGIFADTSARIVLSVGVYKGLAADSIATTYFCSKIKPNKNNGYISRQVAPLLYSYLQNTNADPKEGSFVYPKYHVSSLERAVASSRQKAKILQTLTVSELVDVLNQFENIADYAALSVDERLHCLSLLVSGTMAGNYLLNNNEEGLAVKLLKTAPKNQVKALQDSLLKPSVLVSNPNYNGVDKSNRNALLVRLMDRIQDGFIFGIGGDNYSRFLTVLLKQFRSITPDDQVSKIDSSKYFYWGTVNEPCYEEGPLAINSSMDNNGVVTLQENYIYESKCKYLDKGLLQIPQRTCSAFEPVGFTFLNSPDQDLFPGGVPGKMYPVPAIYVHSYVGKRFSKITSTTAYNAFELFFTGSGIGEIARAKGWWKAFVIVMTAANSADFVMRSPEIRAKLQSTPGGASFLFYWDRCVAIGNGIYLSPFAYKFVKGMISSFRSLTAAERAALGSHADDVGEMVDDAAREIGEGAAAGLGRYELMIQRLDRLGLDNIKGLSREAMSRLDDLTDDLLRQLDADLAHQKYGASIKELLDENPDDISIWQRLKDDPAYYWELKNSGQMTDPRWLRWSAREFFIEITGIGKFFETETVLAALRNRASQKYAELRGLFLRDFGKNLDEYDMFSQVQLYYTKTDYFIADQLFVKYKVVGGQRVVDDILVIENKLSRTTPLTDPQKAALKSSSFTVRSQNAISQFNNTNRLTHGSTIQFSNNRQWYKVYDSSDGREISGMLKME